jgi:tetratricopeptide (TPR) repeat protein
MIFIAFMLINVAIFFLIVRPLTAFVHELGHAIPALLITRKKVSVYVGSYGDRRGSVRVNLGLLEIAFKYRPFKWLEGVCYVKSEGLSINKVIIYIICGPFASIVLALTGSYLAFTYDFHGFFKLVLVLFVASAIFDLFVNLVAHGSPVTLDDGSKSFSDGDQLRRLFYYKRIEKPYDEAIDLYNKHEYDKASSIFTSLIEKDLGDEQIFRLNILSLIYTKNYSKALSIHHTMTSKYSLICSDYVNVGLIKSYLNKHDESLIYYEKALELEPENATALNNLGYEYLLKEHYDKAFDYLNKALSHQPEFSYALSNRGYCYIRTGKLEDGYKDLTIALSLDDKDADTYRNLGVYYGELNDYRKALEFFHKARELNNDVLWISGLIKDAEVKNNN